MKHKLIRQIVTARYGNKVEEYLKEYFKHYNIDDANEIFISLSNLFNNPIGWKGYKNIEFLFDNRTFFVKVLESKIKKLRNSSKLNKNSIIEFFSDNNPYIKYATNIWSIANPGIAFENFIISKEKVAPKFLKQLNKIGVTESSQVLHLHVISNNERYELTRFGYSVPHAHWVVEYYVDALIKASQVLNSNPDIKGYFCEDSWVFDPFVYNKASDGRPYCRFTFLKDNLLVGRRYFVGDALPNGKYWKQFEFSTRNKRRKHFYKTGEYKPKTFGIFYPRENLLNNLDKIKNKYK
ncbi:hypothetical protein GF362_03270 [Candidatus Dojkabacteria bacterium]|nr:hypothetical protein [Candidatus Dojkabacteria bacterium]